jgi:hypothetical protein
MPLAEHVYKPWRHCRGSPGAKSGKENIYSLARRRRHRCMHLRAIYRAWQGSLAHILTDAAVASFSPS